MSLCKEAFRKKHFVRYGVFYERVEPSDLLKGETTVFYSGKCKM